MVSGPVEGARAVADEEGCDCDSLAAGPFAGAAAGAPHSDPVHSDTYRFPLAIPRLMAARGEDCRAVMAWPSRGGGARHRLLHATCRPYAEGVRCRERTLPACRTG